MIRVVGGTYRGKRLNVPDGDGVRPTTDRVREALFNVLAHRFDDPCRGARVLDLFAGAGSLGLEAVSRGAAELVSVEQNRKTAALIHQNSAGFDANLRVVEAGVAEFLAGSNHAPFDLVFMDPPYGRGLIATTLSLLTAKSWLSAPGLICVEQPKEAMEAIPDSYEVAFSRRYGRSTVTILRRRTAP